MKACKDNSDSGHFTESNSKWKYHHYFLPRVTIIYQSSSVVSVLQSRISIAESTVLQQMAKNHEFSKHFSLYPVYRQKRKAGHLRVLTLSPLPQTH